LKKFPFRINFGNIFHQGQILSKIKYKNNKSMHGRAISFPFKNRSIKNYIQIKTISAIFKILSKIRTNRFMVYLKKLKIKKLEN
jgi:hypothetical protein